MPRNWKTFLLTGIAVATAVSCTYAESIFRADFSGSGSKTGKGNIVSKGGSGQLFHYSTNKAAIGNKDGNGYLDVILGAQTKAGLAGGVILTPENADSSWGAMYKDGKLNGAMDFFFSSNIAVDEDSGNSYLRIFEHDNRSNGGLRVNLQNIKNRLLVELIGPAKDAFIRVNGQKTQTMHISVTKNLLANVDYHIAITFKTDDENITTCAMYIVDKNEDIVIGTTLPVAKAAFTLNKDVVKAGFTNGAFRFGKLSTKGIAEATQRFGRLILYDSIPDKFETLNFKLTSEQASEIKKKISQECKKEPAVLFIGSHCGGGCHSIMAKRIINAGFTVNSDPYPSVKLRALTWARAKRYNVIVVSGLGESNGDGSLTPVNKETVNVLRKFVENGGGVFVVGHFGQRQTEISPQETFLKPLGLQPLWKEMPVDSQSVKGSPWQVDFAYTQNISSSPLTQGVKALWYPVPNKRIGDQHHSIAFTADSSWKIPVKGADSSSTTYDIIGSHTSLAGTGLRPTYTKNIPLLAYRDVGKGRVVYFAPCYKYLQSNVAVEDLGSIMLEKGLSGKPSDGLKIFINSLKWLAAPSEKLADFGGAKTDKDLLRHPNQIVYGRAFDWNIEHEFKKRGYDMPGLIGAISNYSTGKGTPAEWVTAAKQAGYRFIVFLEDFKCLDKKKFSQLQAECKKLTDNKFAAFAGFTIDDEIGNHYYYFGNSFAFPDKELYDSKQKVFISYDPNLGGHVKGQLSMTTLRFFIGKNIAKLTGGNYLFSKDAAPFSDWFSNYNSIGVVTSFDGKLAEFCFKDYLDMVASGQAPDPLALTFVDSPEKIKNIKWRTIYKSYINNSDEIIKYFNEQHFYPNNPCTLYISEGPQIDNWTFIGPRDYEGNNKGDFVWQNYRWKLKGAASSSVGLKEVIVWNGTEKFRVFRPDGVKKFEFTLDLNHDKQHYLLIEAIDINGKKAISREMWDRNHRLQEFSCGDRNNQLTYSLSINSKGRKVYAGNNGTLGAPYKRLGDRDFGISPTQIFRSAKGFDGAVYRGPRNTAMPLFKLKGAGSTRIPVVMQAFRGLHSMDTSVGTGKRQYNFTDNIREANVWHTNWKTEQDEYLDVDYHSRYFQLDPDNPVAVLIREIKITLRKDMPNYGIYFNNFLRPDDSRYFVIRSSDGEFYKGGCDNSCDNRGKVTMKLEPGSYISCFGSCVGGMAVFPLNKGFIGTANIASKNSSVSLKIPENKSPQKAGESITFKMLFMGYPANTGIVQDNNFFIEQFREQFGLDGGKGTYKLDIKSGSIISQEYVLKIDGAENKCFAAKITGKLVTRLPIAVEHCNDKLSAFYYDGEIKEARPLGVENNVIWATIIANNQDIFVGHPVTADNDKLHIQVTQAGPNAWSIEVHNPTSEDITAEILLNKFFPPFKNKKAIGTITVKAGSSIYQVIE